jgi:hypothetical protein
MSIIIDVAAEFTGKKAFKQAESATDKLTKSAKSLGKTLGISLGTAAILGYAKASVKAAADDQKAQKQLALALKNVGLERDAASAESYIQRLQSEFGVVDDLLRPAYQQLAIATGDTAETQRLLALSLDLSASTGKDLSSVTGALSKAFLGNNTALSKLGVGISKADLKTKSFEEITSQLAKTFKGAAAESAATFAGSIAKLGVAAENVKEIIGKGIIDALVVLSGDKTVSNLATDMENLATYTADVIRGFGLMAAALQKIPGVSGLTGANIVQAIPILGSYITLLNQAGAKTRRIEEVANQKNPIQSGSYLNKTTAATTKSQKELLKVTAAQLKLAKAKSIFDLQKIQIEAALKGKISEEDRIRLKLMQAIQDENISQIDTYTKALNEVQAKVTTLQSTLAEVYSMDVGNPFISWEIGLDGVKRALIEVNGQSIALTNTIAQNSLAAGLAGGASFAQALSGARYAAQAAAAAGISGATGVMPQVPIAGSGGTAGGGTTTVVQVTVEGSVIAENDLNQAINNALAASGWAGSAIGYSRQAVITAI